MIVIPAGEFMMGSPATETGRDEGPQHMVTIAKPFAVSKFDVTFADWDACVSVAGCSQIPDSGFGRDTKPVINVNFDEAQQYVAWLSKMTGQPPDLTRRGVRCQSVRPLRHGRQRVAMGPGLLS